MPVPPPVSPVAPPVSPVPKCLTKAASLIIMMKMTCLLQRHSQGMYTCKDGQCKNIPADCYNCIKITLPLVYFCIHIVFLGILTYSLILSLFTVRNLKESLSCLKMRVMMKIKDPFLASNLLSTQALQPQLLR